MNPTIYGVMETDVGTVRGEQFLDEALDSMRNNDYDQMPVVDEHGTLVGVVSHRWLVQDGHALNPSAARSTRISNVMRQLQELPPRMVLREDVSACDLLDYYYDHDFVIVVGEGDSVVGIAQLWDVARAFCDRPD